MSFGLRVVLFIFSIGSSYYVMRKIKKAQIRIEDSLFWIIFWVFVVMLSVFPALLNIPIRLLKIDSPANLVYLIFIFLLLVKVFSMSIKMSQLENKLRNLVQKIAIDEKKKTEQVTEKLQDEEVVEE